VVLETERFLNSSPFKERHPEVGEDVKVMGVRMGSRLRITVACAFVSAHVSSLRVLNEARELACSLTDREVELFLNTADDPERGSVYITVTGTSAEQGDDGQVGRGTHESGSRRR